MGEIKQEKESEREKVIERAIKGERRRAKAIKAFAL